MYAPPSAASYGKISGAGFAKAKIIGLGFIFLTHSFLSAFATETPIKTSAPSMTSYNDPLAPLRFEMLANSYFAAFIPSFLPAYIAPFVSQTIKFLP
jgi:hypothetical protein